MDIIFSDGQRYTKPKDKDPYLRCYSKGLFVRPSCYNCRFKGFPRASDLTLGDFWEVNEMYPDVQSSEGVSIIIPNGQRGENIINEIKSSIQYEKIDMNRLHEMNIQYLRPCAKNQNREAFFEGILRNESFDSLAKKYAKSSKGKKWLYDIKKYLYRSGLWDLIKPLWNACKSIKSRFSHR